MDLQEDLNVTAIVVTHDLICAHIIANHAVVLKDGKIRYEGELSKLTSTNDEFLNDFFDREFFEDKKGSK